jgi:hypothetical protein
MKTHFCDRCHNDYTSLEAFDGLMVCHPCIQASKCRECGEHFCVKGWDLCFGCAAEFFAQHPDEHESAVREMGLRDDLDGEAIHRLAQVKRMQAFERELREALEVA